MLLQPQYLLNLYFSANNL